MISTEVRIRQFMYQLLLALGVMTLCRLAFYGFNASFFPAITVNDFLTGIRFDMAALFWILLPYFIISLFQWVIQLPKGINSVKKGLFLFGVISSALLNCIDMEYFRFTQKRSTTDLFTMVGFGDDIFTLIPKFLIDFWYIDLTFIALVILTVLGYRYTEKRSYNVEEKNRGVIANGFIALCMAGFLFIAGRGGMQLIPITIVDAGLNTNIQNVPVILNTPFTLIRTLGKAELKEVNYIPNEQLSEFYSAKHYFADSSGFQKKNVVIIILESFSMEFAGESEKAKQLTPFLQSLKNQSTYMSQCYANGKKSIEALPAILSGIPTLMNDPYISSKYSVNNIESFATYLGKYGYSSSFFHGGKNGTMNFNGFVNAAGFDKYFGKNEYANDADYDGTWGIYDEPYLTYLSKELNKQPQPFISSVFTLSSHHPYSIPKQHQGKFIVGKTPLEKTVQYTDLALKKFFESAKQQPWYNNSIFVITADHTPYTKTEYYLQPLGMYHVPLLIFEPSNPVADHSNKICQQTDILPSVLDKLHYPDSVFSFGQSIYSDNEGFSVQYLNNMYQLVSDNYLYQSTLNQAIGLYNISNDSLIEKNLIGKEKPTELDYQLKAIVQTYNHNMLNNKLSTNE